MLCEPHAFFGKLVDVGGFYFCLAIATQLSISQIICIDINDIGF
jgi:hypothetical protein